MGRVDAGEGLLCKHLVQFFRVKADHDLFADDDGGSGTAVVGANQLKYRALVRTDVLKFKLDTFLRKVGLSPFAWRSTRLAVNNHFLLRHAAFPPFIRSDARHCDSDSASGGRPCLHEMKLRGNAGRALQHGRNRAVLLFGKPYSVFGRLA
jgi:hypothetical protein